MEDNREVAEGGAVVVEGEGPLHLFPMEMWEKIVPEIDDSNAIVNLFTAFPELKPLSHGKECSWLIGPVLQLLMPKHLDPIQNLQCRQVSKLWNTAFETVLDNSPHRHPYKSSTLLTTPGISSSTDHRFTCPSFPLISTNLRKFAISGFASAAGSDGGRNPFPGRSLHINAFVHNSPPFLCEVSPAPPEFQHYTHHIRHLRTDTCFFNNSKKEIAVRKWLQPLLQCLSFLPNLKSLELRAYGKLEQEKEENTTDSLLQNMGPIPVMPFKLETLDLLGLDFFPFPDLHNFLVQTLTTHDKVEALRVTAGREYWNTQNCAVLFPQLTDLKVQLDSLDLDQVLREMISSRVRKLALHVGKSADIGEILTSLQPYSLECLDLQICCWEEEEQLWNPLVTLPTLKDLTLIVTERIHFRFLEGLPSLEYLTLDLDWKERGNEEEDDNPFREFRVAARAYWAGDYDKEQAEDAWLKFQSIWTLLPNLKMLSLYLRGRPLLIRQFVREMPHQIFKSTRYHPKY